ncbi:hypothetical protein [Treponema sp. R80B11-R83G3]
MKVIKIFILIISTFFLFNCVSIMEKTGQVLDGSAFKFKTLSVYKTSGKEENQQEIKISVVEKKDKEKSIIITLENFPMIKLLGSFPDEDGVFILTTLEFLSGSVHGWNEYVMELTGTGNLKFEDTAILKIEEIEPVKITKGRVQRYDTRLTGNEALSALRNRRERILALTDWLSPSHEKGKKIDDFERFWQPILLPETVSKEKRPNGWIQGEDQFQKADSIKWNTGYTERTFPEELWPIRNSGTLLRDWEEAIGWIYLEYEWKNIVELLSKEIILNKIK